jgi:hypothetical protein
MPRATRATADGLKYCKYCDTTKSIEGFPKTGAKCKACRSEWAKQYYEDNKDYILQRNREYDKDHAEEISEYKKQYREENKEHISEREKQYRQEHKEERTAYEKQYREEHKEEMAEYQHQYYEENKEEILAYGREHYKNNKEAYAESHHQYYEDNKEKVLQDHKIYYEANKEAILAWIRQYGEDNKEYLAQKDREYRQAHKEEINEYQKQYKKKKRAEDPFFKTRSYLTSSISIHISKEGGSKNGASCIDYLPWTIDEFWEWIEPQFSSPENLTPDGKVWMTRDNRGRYVAKDWVDDDPATWKWQLDHIIPHSEFPYTSMDDDLFVQCWDLKNLRPLSAKQNQIDGARLSRHKTKGKTK